MTKIQLDRDDKFHHRLSSFLYREGQLAVKKIVVIKPHVFFIQTINDNLLLLKAHRQEGSVLQQWSFFDGINFKKTHAVPFKVFPNERKSIKCSRFVWTLSPYVAGERVTYHSDEERQRVVAVLQKFHKYATGITIKPINKRPVITDRWNKRLNLFKKTEYIFIENGFENLYLDIVQLTERYFRHLTRFPWTNYEKEAEMGGAWIHGDVASHNFIKKKDKEIYLIDFDLLASKPQIYDFIQLGQRFLPYINWNLDKLMSYEMVTSGNLRSWLIGILFPSDVIREWMYAISHTSQIDIQNYLREMELSWVKRKRFSHRADTMLNSL